jgi:hypothetical protein
MRFEATTPLPTRNSAFTYRCISTLYIYVDVPNHYATRQTDTQFDSQHSTAQELHPFVSAQNRLSCLFLPFLCHPTCVCTYMSRHAGGENYNECDTSRPRASMSSMAVCTAVFSASGSNLVSSPSTVSSLLSLNVIHAACGARSI